jgi:predicted enzyme related to lactoylglutathione lyase
MAHGQITHVEFPADDTDRAQRFYSELFGWKFEGYEQLPGYFVFSTGSIESAGGAVGQRGTATGDKLRIYVTVDSIDEALAKVEGLGGTIVSPKSAIPGQGSYAVINDCEGTEVGLYEEVAAA